MLKQTTTQSRIRLPRDFIWHLLTTLRYKLPKLSKGRKHSNLSGGKKPWDCLDKMRMEKTSHDSRKQSHSLNAYLQLQLKPPKKLKEQTKSEVCEISFALVFSSMATAISVTRSRTFVTRSWPSVPITRSWPWPSASVAFFSGFALVIIFVAVMVFTASRPEVHWSNCQPKERITIQDWLNSQRSCQKITNKLDLGRCLPPF